MLKANKVNLARQLRSAPVGAKPGPGRRWFLPVAALALVLGAIVLYTWQAGAVLARQRTRLESEISDPALQQRYAQALAGGGGSVYNDLSALMDALDSAPEYNTALHRQLEAAAARGGAAIEGLEYTQSSGTLTLTCTGPQAGTAAAFAALLEENPRLKAVTYSGYAQVGDRYSFTLSCLVEGGNANAQ